MKTKTGGVLVAAMLIAVGAADLTAQQAGRGRRGGGPEMGPPEAGVESIMSLREQLALTDAQLERLETYRTASLAHRSVEQAGMAELRSQLRAGEIDREEVAAEMALRREAMQATREQHRAEIAAILTVEQRVTLLEIRGERAGAREGRGNGMRARGGDAMGRGPGMGMRGEPGMGMNGGPGTGMQGGPGMGMRGEPGVGMRGANGPMRSGGMMGGSGFGAAR